MVGLQLIAVRLRNRLRDERGIGIVTALAITTAVFAMGAVWTGLATHQAESSTFERSREQALQAAEAGINFAVSKLAADMHYAGTTAPVALADSTGEFEVTVTPVDPTDPDDLDRSIVARGYAPSKDTTSMRAARQIEQQVLLDPADGFNFALFASPGGITGANNSNIDGDVYSASDLSFGNSAQINGDVVTRGNVTTTNQSVIAGDIHALGSATLQNSQTTIQGDVFAGGNVEVGGQVAGDVQSGGSVTVDAQGSVSGTVAENSAVPEPPLVGQPTFTWDAANYTSPSSWTSASNFVSHWDTNRSSFAGAHRVNGGDDNSNKITLDKKWTLGGDVTIVANGPVVLARDFENGTGGDVDLVIVSYSTRDAAISLTNQVTLNDPSIRVLLFAPNGVVDFTQLKDFRGAVYGKDLRLSQHFSLDHAPFTPAGFSFDAASVNHYFVKVRTFREVPFEAA